MTTGLKFPNQYWSLIINKINALTIGKKLICAYREDQDGYWLFDNEPHKCLGIDDHGGEEFEIHITALSLL